MDKLYPNSMINGLTYNTGSMQNGSTYNVVSNNFRHAFNGNGINNGIEVLLNDGPTKSEIGRLGNVHMPVRTPEFSLVGYFRFNKKGMDFERFYDTRDGLWSVTGQVASWNSPINFPMSGLHVEPVDAEYGYTSAYHARNYNSNGKEPEVESLDLVTSQPFHS